jgi:molybdenum cofactor synthesis domain-containing protein
VAAVVSGAAAIIVGNEVLSAKVVDENGAHLIKRLRQRGVPLRTLSIVPDEIEAIVDAVVRARRVARWIITSGGVGPTHDDVTVRAVALALGRAVVRVPRMVEELTRRYGERLTPEALRLADVPEGAELLEPRGSWFPVMACDGVFLLPGVPALFRSMLETVLERLPSTPLHLRSVYLRLGEAEIARGLDAVALAMPDVSVGSYPQFDRGLDYRVKVTLEAQRLDRVEEAARQLSGHWPADAVVRTELDVLGEGEPGEA